MKRGILIISGFLLGLSALAGVTATAEQTSPWRLPGNAEALAGASSALNTAALEGCPGLSPDGRTLYFASNRPGGLGGIDIWVATRPGPDGGWGEPMNPGAPLNSANDDLCPTPLPGGHFLFVSSRTAEDACGGQDIYRTAFHPVSGSLRPENLGCELNSAADEASPSFVEQPDGGVLYFSSTRAGGFAPGGTDADIYVSRRQADGSFGAVELVPGVNTEFDDARPNVRADGLEVFFDSNRPGGVGGADLWTATRARVDDDWSYPVNLGPAVNSPDNEVRAFLSPDGATLYFGSTRAGGEGSQDLYVATRGRAGGHQLERLRATMTGTAAPVAGGRCPVVTLAVRATGSATWLGMFTAEQEQCADPAGPDPLAFAEGTYRWTTEAGDGIVGRYNGRLMPAEGTEEHGFFLLDGRFSVEGGRGRFAGASGHGVADGLLNPATGEFTIALDGSFALPDGRRP